MLNLSIKSYHNGFISVKNRDEANHVMVKIDDGKEINYKVFRKDLYDKAKSKGKPTKLWCELPERIE